jgi:hypothetical protein
MTFMFEVFYKLPENPKKEAALTDLVATQGGHLDFREVGDQTTHGPICLTYEFADIVAARQAADRLRQQGEHVEGPYDYGA